MRRFTTKDTKGTKGAKEAQDCDKNGMHFDLRFLVRSLDNKLAFFFLCVLRILCALCAEETKHDAKALPVDMS
jgi:hypothetical protein